MLNGQQEGAGDLNVIAVIISLLWAEKFAHVQISGLRLSGTVTAVKEGANKQVISSQADSLIKISRIWADFFPANTSNQPI